MSIENVKSYPERTLLSYLEDPVVVFSAKGKFVYCNPAFREKFSIPWQGSVGKHISQILPGWMAEPVILQLKDIRPGGVPRKFWLHSKNERYKTSMGVITLNGNALGAVITIWDATKEIQHKKQNLELFRAMIDDLEFPVQEIFSLIAHPGGMTPTVGGGTKNQLSQIENGLTRMRDFAEILFGEFRHERVSFSPARLIAITRKSLRPLANQNRIYLEEASPRELPDILGDPALLTRALGILVEFMLRQASPDEVVIISSEIIKDKDDKAFLGYAITITGNVNTDMALCSEEVCLIESLGGSTDMGKRMALKILLARRLAGAMGGEVTTAAHELTGTTVLLRVPVEIHQGPM